MHTNCIKCTGILGEVMSEFEMMRDGSKPTLNVLEHTSSFSMYEEAFISYNNLLFTMKRERIVPLYTTCTSSIHKLSNRLSQEEILDLSNLAQH